MVKFSIIVWISVVAFLNNGNVKPVESEDSNAKADEKYENVLQELKAIKREVENYRKTSTRLLQENKIMKNELDKLHVNDQIQAKMIANKRLKRSKRGKCSFCSFFLNKMS
jgi:predicted RNase H-like nuclease (RuvC/YqgF family)